MDVLVDRKASFLNFVYPISFDPTAFEERLRAFESEEWRGRKGAFKVWEKQNFPEEDLLPHVSKFLNPPDHITPTARLWKLSNEALSSAVGGLGGGEHSNTSMFLVTRSKEISFQLSSINMVLFNSGIGFITLCAEPVTENISDWLDFLHFFRFTGGQRNVKVKFQRKTGLKSTTQEALYTPFFPIPAGGLKDHPEGMGIINDIICGLLNSDEYQHEQASWWSEIYTSKKLLPFASIFVDDVPTAYIPLLLYQLRNFFHSREDTHPSDYDLSSENDLLLAYGKEEWFFFSLDGGGFAAFNSPKNKFTRTVLPDHLQKHYFLLYILTLHQRFAIMKLLDDIATHWYDKNEMTGKKEENEKRMSFEKIRDNLLSFSARGYYAQAMQGEHHHKCYNKWQAVFQVERLFNEVKDEVWSMNEYIRMQHDQKLQEYEEEKRIRAERLEKRLSLLAWILGVPALGLSFYETVNDGDLGVSLMILLGGLFIGVILYNVVRNRTHSREP